jgi:hypothetical protein
MFRESSLAIGLLVTMTKYRSENPGASPPPEWSDLTKMYDVVGPYFEQRVPPDTVSSLARWVNPEDLELPFGRYKKIRRVQWRAMAAADPRAPVDLLVQWADATTGGLPAVVMLILWLGELLSLAHPGDEPETLQGRVNNARGSS